MKSNVESQHQQQTELGSDLFTRRNFLHSTSAAVGAFSLAGQGGWLEAATTKKRRPKVAIVFTIFTHRSHGHVLIENFLEPYLFNGKLTDPGIDVVSFYGDQFPSGDMSRKVSKTYGVPLFKTIDEALCLGGKDLAVDAVLAIGEHGSYPSTEFGQVKYPRKRFFDEIVAVMKRSNCFVPLFNDKHLSYRWDWAKEMYDDSQQYGIPFMAGSSVPLAQRRPPLELPPGAEIEEAVSVHGGPVESYDFHGLEVLQSMVEARKGGETGISKVEFLDGPALLKAANEGRFSIELANAAVKAELGDKTAEFLKTDGVGTKRTHGLLLTYKDGLKATVLRMGKKSTRWNFACRLKKDPKIHATAFYVGPWRNRNLFKALSHAIQHHFIHNKAPYPVERTLLVTGVLESAMKSRHNSGQPQTTPHLEFAYAPQDFRGVREMGASWKLITEDLPEPEGFQNGRLKKK